MASWQADIYRGELAQFVKAQYRNLLCIGKTDEEAQSVLVEYCLKRIPEGKGYEVRMWLALALRQWEYGRLNDEVRGRALKLLESPVEDINPCSCEILRQTLMSEQPERKKLRMPSWAKRCPYKVGSLLAYKIMSHEKCKESPYWGKYVLLRVIMIRKHALTPLAPDGPGAEQMLVGLYDWWGDDIPDPSIAENLQFTPIGIMGPMLPLSALRGDALKPVREIPQDKLARFLQTVTTPRVETCSSLDWHCCKGIDRKQVFTLLGCDENFVPDMNFFKTGVTQYSLTHSIPFDATLCNRLEQLSSVK